MKTHSSDKIALFYSHNWCFLAKNVSEKGRSSIINSNFLKWGVTNVVNMQRLVQCFSLTWFQLWLAIHEPRLTVLHPTNSTQCSLLSRWSMGMASHVTFRGNSKMTSPRKCKILDPPSPYVNVSHFFHYTPSNVTRQTMTNFFLDQRPL